ncbi:MAG: hypothetical protein ACODAQ_08800 [Phycisphaeraceae bacterium]
MPPLPLALLILAQESGAPTAAKPLWQLLLENSLALTLLFIFLVAIIGVIFQLRRKDKCLKLLADHHVSYLTTAGRPVWGDLTVYSQGLELTFDAPHTTGRGLTKSSALIYENDLATCLALCRIEDALTDAEKRKRQRQIRRSFRPGPLRRTMRALRNILNTLRDAFSKAINTIIGAMARMRPDSAVLTTQQTQVNEIGQTLLAAAGNAYEPLLEAHIGKPVVLKIASTTEPTNQPFELPGYLVDYTDRFIAVFNVAHESIESFELKLTESTEREGVTVTLTDGDATVRCTGPDPIVVMQTASNGEMRKLALPLLPGCAVSLPRTDNGAVTLTLQRTRHLDVVCPRALASVHFGADTPTPARRWHGLAPTRLAELLRPTDPPR